MTGVIAMTAVLVAAAAGYLLGSVPVGYLLARSRGVDIRSRGSGNIGTTNVWRTLGPLPGLTVLVGDVGKGVIAVLIGRALGGTGTEVVAGLAALAGHSWPLFLGFRGGKIIATGLGVFLVMVPAAALAAAIVWVVVVAVSRYVSLGSILASVSLPAWIWFLSSDRVYLAAGIAFAALAVYKHVPNIKRLLSGREFRIGRNR